MARDLLLLVHLPKTAGTTLAQLLRYHYSGGAFMGAGNVLSRPDEAEPRLQAIARKPAIRAASGHVSFGLAEQVLPDATFVTILREPVARTLSQYYFLTELGRGGGLVPAGPRRGRPRARARGGVRPRLPARRPADADALRPGLPL